MGDDGEATVQKGSRVRIQEDDGQEHVLLIRGDAAESWAPDSISADTPLAQALLGHRVGDEVTIELHRAVPRRSVVILAIE